MPDQNYPSENQGNHNYRTPVPFPEEFDMILAYREKMRTHNQIANVLRSSSLTPTHHENLGVLLDKNKIQDVLNQDGCEGLVAFFAIEPSKEAYPARNTMVLMGVDKNNELLPFNDGLFTIAQETWAQILPVSDDNESESAFQNFFRIQINTNETGENESENNDAIS